MILRRKSWCTGSVNLTPLLSARDVKIVPGLYKIFDEILVNAADNKIRDPSMDHIKVTVDRENGTISIYNNGRGIPIEIHQVMVLLLDI
jgi:DNA topoisomerase-2